MSPEVGQSLHAPSIRFLSGRRSAVSGELCHRTITGTSNASARPTGSPQASAGGITNHSLPQISQGLIIMASVQRLTYIGSKAFTGHRYRPLAEHGTAYAHDFKDYRSSSVYAASTGARPGWRTSASSSPGCSFARRAGRMRSLYCRPQQRMSASRRQTASSRPSARSMRTRPVTAQGSRTCRRGIRVPASQAHECSTAP